MKLDAIERIVRETPTPDQAEVASRVFADPALWPAFEEALYPAAEPTDEERSVIRRLVADRCTAGARTPRAALASFVAARLARLAGKMDDFALAAATRDGGASAGAAAPAPDDPVTFVFVSETDDAAWRSKARAWRAELTLPSEASVDTMLPIIVTDGAGGPAEGGLLRLAGVALPVAGGRADIPYGLFLSGLKEAHVERVTADGHAVPGTLALF